MRFLDPVQWLLVLAFCAASVTGYHFWSDRLDQQGYERGYAKARAECQEASTRAREVARLETARMQRDKDHAEQLASDRLARQKRDADLVRLERDSLRHQLDADRARLRDAPVEAVRQYAAAASDVFEQCARRYSEVAEAADGHASDALKLEQGWPTLPNP
jgi:hypothetical protein